MAADELKYWSDLPRPPTDQNGALEEIGPLAKGSGTDVLDKLLEERRRHRHKLLKFIMGLTLASFALLSLIVIVQIGARLYFQKPFSVFDGHELEFLISGVFGQIIGLIAIIVNSLWNDKTYLDNMPK